MCFNQKKGKLIIVSGPSGSGKTTIVKYLLSCNLNLFFSISACSRPKRKNEKDGIDYHFLSVDEFKLKIAEGEFLEWEEVYQDNFYGTLKSEVLNKETFPVDTRLNINTASARQIADSLPGVGLKTARDIKDLQTTMTGEKYTKLEQLRNIKRIDWDTIFKENLVRVD